ncbi:MAG: hypothetical protein V5A45_03175 [Haloarculaceae archaeon]
MGVASPWLDVHRGRQPRDGSNDTSDAGVDSEGESGECTDTTGSETETRTNPWEDVDTARRPSQTDVDLPTPATDSPADD